MGIKIKGGGATSQYNTAANWVWRGEIGDMPDVVCCVFQRRNGRMQHTGLHIGGGKVIHCSAGVQWGDTSDKAWTHYAIPAGLYTADELAAAGAVKADKPSEVVVFNLRRGSKGSDVTRLQTALNALGYACGAAGRHFRRKNRGCRAALPAGAAIGRGRRRGQNEPGRPSNGRLLDSCAIMILSLRGG